MAEGGGLESGAVARPHTDGSSRGVPAAAESTAAGRWLGLILFIVVFVAALVPRMFTAGEHVMFDENLWMERSDNYLDAVTEGEFDRAHSAALFPIATMPGTPVMVVGAVAHAGYSTFDMDPGVPFNESRVGLMLSQRLMAGISALLIATLAVGVRRWAGDVAAWITGAILVGEPWLTGLSSQFHTDAFVALFGATGLVFMALAFEVPAPRIPTRHPLLMAGLGGALISLAPLTKLTGLNFGFGAITVFALSMWAARSDRPLLALRSRQMVAATAGALSMVVLTYTAVIVDPTGQWDLLSSSANLAPTGQLTFFRGEQTENPSAWFFPYTLALRFTPWLFVGALAGAGVCGWLSAQRGRALVLLSVALPTMIVLSSSAKKNDRYVLPVLALAAVLAALAAQGLWDRRQPSGVGHQHVLGAGVVATLVLSAWGSTVAPAGMMYFSPLFGGGQGAVDTTWIGNLDANHLAAREIQRLEGGDCEGVTVSYLTRSLYTRGSRPLDPYWPDLECNTSNEKGVPPDYVVAYIGEWQKLTEDTRDKALRRELLSVVEVRGIPVFRIWRGGPLPEGGADR